MAKNYLVTFLSDDDVGTQYANTICVHDDELTARSGSQFIGEVETWLKTKYCNFLPTSMTLRALRAYHIPATYGADTDVATLSESQAGALSIGTGTVPREVTCTLTLRSTHTSRRSMGRLSLPSPRNPSTLDGSSNWVLASSYIANIKTFADALLAGRDIGTLGADGHLSTRIYSRKDHIEGDTDPTWDVSTYIVRPRPRWLRRRTTAP